MPAILSKAIRILLVGDCATLCAGLRALIKSQQGLEVIGEAGGRADALAIIARECPDIILLNLDLDSENDLDLLRELLAAARESRIVVLAGRHNPAAYYRAVRLGALGIVLKEQIVECLSVAIRDVHSGKAWLDGAIMAKVLYCLSHGIEEAAATDSEAVKLAELTETSRRSRSAKTSPSPQGRTAWPAPRLTTAHSIRTETGLPSSPRRQGRIRSG